MRKLQQFELGYRPSLDGLRAIAILAVMAFNAQLIKGGFIGVDIFFVLSGFLITSILLQRREGNSRIGFKEFYIRRAFRLLPAISVLALFCIGYALFLQSGDKTAATLKGVLYTMLYVANWAQVPPNPPGIGPLSHAWSLSVEEQFYIAWPFLLMGMLRLNRKWIALSILAILISASALYSGYLWEIKASYFRMYFGSDTRAQELLIGCFAGLIVHWNMIPRVPRLKTAFHIGASAGLVAIVLSLFLARYNEPFVYTGGFTLVCIATAVLIVDLVLFPSQLSRSFEFRPFVWIGKISYGLYLWHYPIFEASKRILEDRVSAVAYTLVGVALTFLVATGSYYLLEQPALTLLRRYTSAGRLKYVLSPAA